MTEQRKATGVSELTLPSGLRVVHLQVPRARVNYCGVAILAGSRDENVTAGQDGLAHFVEHTLFKGTAKRSSYHIINRMEAVGGELNAFTTKEDTVVYSAFPSGNLSRALELIADLVCNSRFPAEELDKERQVVIDEINSYLDSPADAVYDDFEDMAFRGSSLGHNILGSKKNVSKLSSEDCRHWIRRFYRPERIVAFYAGNIGFDRFVSLVEKYFSFPETSETIAVPTKPSLDLEAEHIVRRIRGNHQAHVVIGKVIPVLDDKARASMSLLTNILGGPGMNSLLNVDLRERRGLVYNVEASLAVLSDCALSTVYFGCDEEDRRLCHDLVTKRIESMALEGLTSRNLAAAKKQYSGQMILARESLENRIISIARAILIRGHALSENEQTALLNELTPEDLRASATFLLSPSSLSLIP